MIRLFFLLALIIIAFKLVQWGLSLSGSNRCHDCKGQGYWIGTRGEKNTCKTCGGNG